MFGFFNRLGQWAAGLGGRLASGLMPDEEWVDTRQLDPARRRAYLGALLASIGKGLGDLGAGRSPDVYDHFIGAVAPFAQRDLETLRRRKAEEILQSNTMTDEQKLTALSNIGASDVAKAFADRIRLEMEKNRPVGVAEVADEKGQPQTVLVLPDGRQIPVGKKPVPLENLDTGGEIRRVNPYTGEATTTIPKSMTPGEKSQEQIQQQKLDLERDRLIIDQTRALVDAFSTLHSMNMQREKLALDKAEFGLQRMKTMAELAAAGLLNPNANEVRLPGKLAESDRQTMMAMSTMLRMTEQLKQDLMKNGNPSVIDVLAPNMTKRGRNLQLWSKSLLMLSRGLYQTGVLQKHEMEAIEKAFGSITGLSAPITKQELKVKTLDEIQKIIADSMNDHYMVMTNRVPPEYMKAIKEQLDGTAAGQPQQMDNMSTYFVDPQTGKLYVRMPDGSVKEVGK